MDENLKKELDAFLEARKADRKEVRESAVDTLQERRELEDQLRKCITTVIWPALKEIASMCRAKHEAVSVAEPPQLGSGKPVATGIHFSFVPLQIDFQSNVARAFVDVNIKFHDAPKNYGSYTPEEITEDFVWKTVLDLLKQS